MEVAALTSCRPDLRGELKMDYPSKIMNLALYTMIALVGEITGNMRAVMVSMAADQISVRFIFFRKPSAEEIETMGYIVSEVLSNYDDATGDEKFDVQNIGRILMTEGEMCVFQRKEGR